jgi:hypothetical protein
MSFGPISWLLVGEVFPLRVRGQAIALATLTNFASNFGVSLVLPSIQQAVGPSGERRIVFFYPHVEKDAPPWHSSYCVRACLRAPTPPPGQRPSRVPLPQCACGM